MIDPWRAQQFKHGYSGEFLPLGQRSWRFVKSGGDVVVFPSRTLALEAAKNAYLQRLEPTIRATIPQDPEKVAAKLADEAENWLRSKREDVKSKTTLHKAGKRSVVVIRGRAVA